MLRNSLQTILGVLRDNLWRFVRPNDAKTPCWLRLWMVKIANGIFPLIPHHRHTPGMDPGCLSRGFIQHRGDSFQQVELTQTKLIKKTDNSKQRNLHFRLSRVLCWSSQTPLYMQKYKSQQIQRFGFVQKINIEKQSIHMKNRWQPLTVFFKKKSLLFQIFPQVLSLATPSHCPSLCWWWLIWSLQNDAKMLKNDWNPCTLVLIWEYSARAIQWIPTWQRLDGWQ